MEFCPEKLTTKQRFLTFQDKISHAVEICRGLAGLHRLGIVHGDLKPDNILLSCDNVAKLSDFGLSYNIESKVSSQVEKGGTAGYQAPELTLSKDERALIDPRLKDVYALGGVLLFLFSGEGPWQDEHQNYLIRQQIEHHNAQTDFLPVKQLAKLRELAETDEDIIANVEFIIKRCFSRVPEKRGSSRQVLVELEMILSKRSNPAAHRKEEVQKKLEAGFFEGYFKKIETKLDEKFDLMKGMMDTMISMMNPYS
eukprot:TRINITY_DN3039_c0_g1_i14.p1 TRINITY_DN3039_c0_g1~~TRINITY_DN3039_c0_g1_i14.p1  ORF type:complete len:254 (-),score=60.37 TRINITY_DN3039_c0_g1_i14:99-860(-)